MKKRILGAGMALCFLLTLTGCASMLERSYEVVTPHVDRPVTADDPTTLRVENYRELVSAVLYLVSQGAETGTIQFQDYTGQAETDLAAACLEVADQDPLGAYAVDYIEHELSRVMSHSQASLTIRYRRSMDQVRSIVNVTGTRAIRDKVEDALTAFSSELVLRVAYFAEDEQFIRDLARQVYHDAPAAIPCLPEMEVTLYPDTGSQRIVEVLFAYPESPETLAQRRDALTAAAREAALPMRAMSASQSRLNLAADLLAQRSVYDPSAGSTAYDALISGAADSQGMALAYLLLAQAGTDDVEGHVVEGTAPPREGEDPATPRYWVRLVLEGETLYLDPSAEQPRLLTPQELYGSGYRWPDQPVPAESATPQPTN